MMQLSPRMSGLFLISNLPLNDDINILALFEAHIAIVSDRRQAYVFISARCSLSLNRLLRCSTSSLDLCIVPVSLARDCSRHTTNALTPFSLSSIFSPSRIKNPRQPRHRDFPVQYCVVSRQFMSLLHHIVDRCSQLYHMKSTITSVVGTFHPVAVRRSHAVMPCRGELNRGSISPCRAGQSSPSEALELGCGFG
ncbi:hypothetical protein BDW66DRAFT_63411 [Aspergillus desertorum]